MRGAISARGVGRQEADERMSMDSFWFEEVSLLNLEGEEDGRDGRGRQLLGTLIKTAGL